MSRKAQQPPNFSKLGLGPEEGARVFKVYAELEKALSKAAIEHKCTRHEAVCATLIMAGVCTTATLGVISEGTTPSPPEELQETEACRQQIRRTIMGSLLSSPTINPLSMFLRTLAASLFDCTSIFANLMNYARQQRSDASFSKGSTTIAEEQEEEAKERLLN